MAAPLPSSSHNAQQTKFISPKEKAAKVSISPAYTRPLEIFYANAGRINSIERTWRDRYAFLVSRGYRLRPRFHPEWTPSWLRTSSKPWECEDAIDHFAQMVIDATSSDGLVVCIKRTLRKSNEIEIGRYLSPVSSNPNTRNHCVEIFDVFSDDSLPDMHYIVMPVLRPYNNPEFGAVGEVIDFVSQLLDGMEFMHDKLVAHGDLTGPNIMMDGRPIIPEGWHFTSYYLAPNGVDEIVALPRIDHPVRYVIIDYDYSTKFSPGQSHVVYDSGGRDMEPPELSVKPSHYDAFKLDVFTLGNVFKKDFHKEYDGLEFLEDLMTNMMTADFHARPTAKEAALQWAEIKAQLDACGVHRWRLRKRNENFVERVVLDAFSVAREGFRSVKRLFLGEEEPQAQA